MTTGAAISGQRGVNLEGVKHKWGEGSVEPRLWLPPSHSPPFSLSLSLSSLHQPLAFSLLMQVKVGVAKGFPPCALPPSPLLILAHPSHLSQSPNAFIALSFIFTFSHCSKGRGRFLPPLPSPPLLLWGGAGLSSQAGASRLKAAQAGSTFITKLGLTNI